MEKGFEFNPEKYFLGSVCRENHFYNDLEQSIRYRSTRACIICAKIYRQKHKKKIARYRKSYYRRNKKYFKEYAKRNKLRIQEYLKSYYQKNKERYKMYYQKNKKRISDYMLRRKKRLFFESPYFLQNIPLNREG